MAPSRCACTAFKLVSLIETPGAFLLRRPPRSPAAGVVLAARALCRFSVVIGFPRIVPEHVRRFPADGSGIAAAQENADVHSGSGFIATRNECGKGGSTPRLGDYP